MVNADNLDIHHADAYAVDKSQHYESNGSSKQHDVRQMLVHLLLDAFVHKPLHRVPVNWPLLEDEPHEVEVPDSPIVDVDVSSAEAIAFADCRLNVVVAVAHKSDVDNCLLTSLVLVKLKLVDAVLASSLLIPFRNKKFCCVMNDWVR
jgi:hypothetical protein